MRLVCVILCFRSGPDLCDVAGVTELTVNSDVVGLNLVLDHMLAKIGYY